MTSSMALPSAWIDRLFGRFAALYGRHWFDMWVDVSMADVKDAWATELAEFNGEQIVAALKKLGKFPPTLPEFVSLCKPAPVHASHLLLPSPQKEVLSARAEKVGREVAQTIGRAPKRDPKRWARDILEREKNGERLLPVQIQFAREALC